MVSRLKLLKIIIAIAVLMSFGLLLRSTDMQKVVLSIQRIGIGFLFLLLLTYAAYYFAAVGWKYCLGKQAQNLKTADLFLIRHIGEMVSLVNPASVIGGEAVKVYMLQKKGVDKTNIIASVLVSRVMMAITQIFLFCLSLAFVYCSGKKISPTLKPLSLIPLYAVILLIVLSAIAGKNNYVKKSIRQTIIIRFFGRLVLKWKIKEVFTRVQLFFRTNKKGLFFCTLFFTLHWITGSLEIYFILLFLGIKTSIVHILLVDMGIVLFKTAGFFIPGQIGVEEIGNKIMLELIGIPDTEIWVTVSVLRRSRQLFWIVVGLAAYLIVYKKANNATIPE